jgi:hypothetical protein
VYHLPSSQSVGMSIRMNLSLFFINFASSIMCLLVFHSIFYGLEYIFSHEARKWQDTWTILQFSAVSPVKTRTLLIPACQVIVLCFLFTM